MLQNIKRNNNGLYLKNLGIFEDLQKILEFSAKIRERDIPDKSKEVQKSNNISLGGKTQNIIFKTVSSIEQEHR